MPKVSIVIPVFNIEKYLQGVLEQLCRQTLQDIEIILIDDGSTDNSGEIRDSYAQKDNRIISVHTENHGVSAARNLGISAARGEYIGFCDGDDMPDIDYYETLYRLITENKTDVAIVQAMAIYEDNTKFTTAKNQGIFVWHSTQELLKALLTNTFGMAVYKILLKREIAKSVTFEVGRKINEDKMYLFEAFKKANSGCYLDEAKYKYFRRRGSASFSEFSEKHLDSIYFAENINYQVQNEFPELKDYAQADLIRAHLQVLKLMVLENGRADFMLEWKRSVKFLRKMNTKFCKKYLDKNNYIKWLALKINSFAFIVIVKLFCRN
jgi:glycosyltransferase involved in cell wall biosynthesis